MGLVCVVVLIIGFGEYRRIEQDRRLTTNLVSTKVVLESEIKGLNDKITNIVAQNNLLNEAIQTEIQKSEELLDQVDQVSDTADALNKLSKVDTQLLQKYSKVFFLNEHYVPSGLSTIPSKYVYEKGKNYEMHSKVESYLEKMLKAAEEEGIIIKVISAYRSFDTQAILKSGYQVVYGAGTANQFSADQGYSEHQLGTTLDFTTPETKDNFDLFDSTPAYKWLKSNAYKFGFIISYPKSNAYYTYEPWHWRFVGVDLANRLHRNGDYFYDMDQRKINNYLGVFFD
jgi:LAS superfamily LD-carboxypeptidase LdcB